MQLRNENIVLLPGTMTTTAGGIIPWQIMKQDRLYWARSLTPTGRGTRLVRLTVLRGAMDIVVLAPSNGEPNLCESTNPVCEDMIIWHGGCII